MKTIRKYFKNAKIVECLLAGTYEIDLKTIYKDRIDGGIWCKCNDSTHHCLLFKDGEFAQIIEVKEPKQEQVLLQSSIDGEVIWGKPKQETMMYSEEEIGLLNKMFDLYWYENNNEHEDNLEEWELSKRLFKQFKNK